MPADDWMTPGFNDNNWNNSTLPQASELNNWTSRDVWTRSWFDYTPKDLNKLLLSLRHDDDVEVYLNGQSIYRCAPCYNGGYAQLDLDAEIRKALVPGRNLLAIHCTNTGGPSFIDAGILEQLAEQPRVKAVQRSVEMTATQTRYKMSCGAIDIELAFISPLLMEKPEILSRPVSYLQMKFRSNDQRNHAASIYLGLAGDIAVNVPSQAVKASVLEGIQRTTVKVGSADQQVLKRKGDG